MDVSLVTLNLVRPTRFRGVLGEIDEDLPFLAVDHQQADFSASGRGITVDPPVGGRDPLDVDAEVGVIVEDRPGFDHRDRAVGSDRPVREADEDPPAAEPGLLQPREDEPREEETDRGRRRRLGEIEQEGADEDQHGFHLQGRTTPTGC